MTSARRELTASVLASAAAGGLGLFAGAQTWATLSADRPAPLPPFTGVLAGSAHAPVVPAAALVLLAAAVVLPAVRGSGRVAVGALMAVSGVALVWSGWRALAGGLAQSAAAVPVVVGTPSAEISAVWPVATALAGVLATVAGLLVILRSRHWPAMGRRYEQAPPDPAPVRQLTDEERAELVWNALDRGEDPTDPAPPGPGRRPV